MVLNALDNVDARRHMNRICFAAKVPLVESGSAGYMGQVQTILPGSTECYECQAKPVPTRYPYCTIHATPSQSIHNVIWAKEYLFRKLFGAEIPEDDENEEDAAVIRARQQEVPDELKREAEEEAKISEGRLQFHLAFKESIFKLLRLEALWEKRKRPTMLTFSQVVSSMESGSNADAILVDQRVLSLSDTAKLFVDSCNRLRERLRQTDIQSIDFDKDDNDALDFVTSAANLRSFCYGIEQLSRFDVKQKAGNIIPAIATANAIIAGLVVVEALKIVQNQRHMCRFTYLNQEPNKSGSLFAAVKLDSPNPSCFVCSSHHIRLDVIPSLTLKEFLDLILVGHLKVSQPNVVHGERILYESGEDEDFSEMLAKTLEQLGLVSGSILDINDNLSALELSISLTVVASLVQRDPKSQDELHLKWRLTSDEPKADGSDEVVQVDQPLDAGEAEPEQKKARKESTAE